jgi:hypothetical protein
MKTYELINTNFPLLNYPTTQASLRCWVHWSLHLHWAGSAHIVGGLDLIILAKWQILKQLRPKRLNLLKPFCFLPYLPIWVPLRESKGFRHMCVLTLHENVVWHFQNLRTLPPKNLRTHIIPKPRKPRATHRRTGLIRAYGSMMLWMKTMKSERQNK